MPRLHVTLPRELYDEMKSHGWSPSEVLQDAIRERLREEERQREVDRWYAEMVARFGEPTPEEEAEVQAAVDRLLGRTGETETGR